MGRSLSKSLRFEVFKRDSFRCQYCGSEAPAVVLHVDHIEAVANGGLNDITNLITSCEGCNLGKSDKKLSDHVAVAKSRGQLDDLQARREQLELMMQWRKGLRELDSEVVESIAAYWKDAVPGFSVNDKGKRALSKLYAKYSVDEICSAIDNSVRVYVQYAPDGEATAESAAFAFSKIPGVCNITRASEKNPDLQQLFYIRGILRNRIPGYFNPVKAMEWLKAARSWGVEIDELTDIARSVRNWTQFGDCIREVIKQAKGEVA